MITPPASDARSEEESDRTDQALDGIAVGTATTLESLRDLQDCFLTPHHTRDGRHMRIG